jgi:hypothetical protein
MMRTMAGAEAISVAAAPAGRTRFANGGGGLDERFRSFDHDELAPPRLAIPCEWCPPLFPGCLTIWSAMRRAREAGREGLLRSFADVQSGVCPSRASSSRLRSHAIFSAILASIPRGTGWYQRGSGIPSGR